MFTTSEVPETFKEVVQCSKWKEAMKKKIKAIEDNETW